MADPSLWDSMAMIDGMRGYGARYALYSFLGENADSMHHRSIPPLYTPSVTHPNILTPERKPVQDFADRVDYIPAFLCSESTARGVIATRCQFGWPQISVPVTCLFIDSDKLGNLPSLASNQDIPVVIIRTELENLNDNVARASELIAADVDDIVERSQRKSRLRMNRTPRVAPEQGRLFHGQSISLKNEESKGSIAVFLSTAENKLYALTAYHVVPPESNESQVITPGGLDSLTQLLAALVSSPNHSAISDLLTRREDPFGDVEYGYISSNKEGWRSDCALIRIYDGWVAENGKWLEEDTLKELAIGAERLSQGFTGTNGLVGCCDPEGGQTCYKDGATTGCTVGVVGSHYCLQFRKGTTDLAPVEDDPANIVVSKVLLVQAFPIDEQKDFCERGDSGSGVFVSDPKADGWNLSGLLVSKLKILRGSFGVIVPQSQVFRSLEEHTGMSWRLAGQTEGDNQK